MNNDNNVFTLVDWEEGDWVAVYEGDRLVHEGHSVSGDEMLELIGFPFNRIEIPIRTVSDDYFGEGCCGIRSLAKLEDMLNES